MENLPKKREKIMGIIDLHYNEKISTMWFFMTAKTTYGDSKISWKTGGIIIKQTGL